MVGNWGLIDRDTPNAAFTKPSYQDGTDLQLVFSDEFNTDGRTFYPGDDPYWEAVDLHYWEVSGFVIQMIVSRPMISSDEQHRMV
jgi:beta-glucan synthesis-associated protein KRE6